MEPDTFAAFKPDDYRFSPSRHRVEAFLLRHMALLVALPFLIAVTVTLIAWYGVDNNLTFSDFVHEAVDEDLLKHVWKDDLSEEQWRERWRWSADERSMYNMIWSDSLVLAPFTLIALIEVILYRRFVRKAPKTFLALAEAERLRPGTDTGPRRAATFARDLENELRSPRRVWITLGLIGLAVTFSLSTGIPANSLEVLKDRTDTLAILGNVWIIATYIGLPLVWAYVFGTGIWVVYTAAKYLRWLPQVFNLDIQPRHPDNCGGMKRVGDLCLDLAFMCIIPALLVSFWEQGGILARSISELTTITYVILILMIILSFLFFFVPLWVLHTDMVRKKARFQDDAIKAIAPVEIRLRRLLAQAARSAALPSVRDTAGTVTPQEGGTGDGKDADESAINALKDKLDLLKKLYFDDLKYPTWPFDANISLRFITPQIVPLIVLIAGMGDKDTTILKDVFDAIGRLLG